MKNGSGIMQNGNRRFGSLIGGGASPGVITCTVKVVTIYAIRDPISRSDMATSPRQTIVLWPNPLPLECGVIRAHDRSLRGVGNTSAGFASGRLNIQVSEDTNFEFDSQRWESR